MKHVIIIGNGISGITAAREIRKRSDVRITVISGESEHFFSRTALMYVYMGHMRFADIKPYADDFWATNRIDLKHAWVKHVDSAAKRITFEDGGTTAYDVLVIASGSRTNKFGWPGQDLQGVQGLYSLQDLGTMERDTKGISHAVIVGGGLIGVEMAEMLMSRRIPVTFLVREDLFWGGILPEQDANLIGRHLAEHGVDLRFNTEMDSILADANGRVRSVVTKSGEEIRCQFVGITTGVSPNVAFLKDSAIACDRGVLVNGFLETNVPDVYAAGDCAQFIKHPDPERRPVEQVWYTGRMMGATVARTITGTRTVYAPGPWFNSAKFFDIEYQTYGWVRNRLMPGQAGHYWEHPEARIALHLVWDEESSRFIGANVFGMRLRHGVFDAWLRAGVSVDHVVAHLREAHFDAEFHARHEQAITSSFAQARVGTGVTTS
jgi:NADPH-dependent 2,4-dienoyl-CoA reductase/sulfur reductase-like enzyme